MEYLLYFLLQATAGSTLNSGIGIRIEFKPGSRDWIPGLGLGSEKAIKEKLPQLEMTERDQKLQKIPNITKNYRKFSKISKKYWK